MLTEKMIEAFKREMWPDGYTDEDIACALTAALAELPGEPVARVDASYGDEGLLLAAFDAKTLPVGTLLYAAPPAPAVVKALDLSNLLKHAFLSGSGSAITRQTWAEYDPSECDAYERIRSALEDSN